MIEVSATSGSPEAVIRYRMSDVPFGAATRHLMIQKLGWSWIVSLLVALLAAGLYAAGVGAWIAWMGIVQLALVAVTTVAVWISVHQRWRQKMRLAGTHATELAISRDGLHTRSALGEARIAWPMVRRIERRTVFWLLHFRASDEVVVVPATALTQVFRSALELHAGAAGIQVR